MINSESRLERAQRRVREAEANCERQRMTLARLLEAGDTEAHRSGLKVQAAFRDVVIAMKLRLREAERKFSLTDEVTLPAES